ncbi:phosphate ABC transporter substrate-binding protein [Streptomyces triticagri]|uniref:Phosphate ABC transporter substrate-binding protein n=1 Tax=Streptomyces triticagri TaxID=2293568 RepID=A0A372M6N2_9ACTN|nr:substrate-binding domain-containing protein [Streptomyces triticagri]RFU85957.1 phosphate ABC transporter substrate-binding protein [Streptomyces triticagri]
MEWLTAENVIAVFSLIVGVIAPVAIFWYERRVPRRRRIGHRVQMDAPIGSAQLEEADEARLGVFDEIAGLPDATLVLIRIENDGSQAILATDYTSPRPYGLTVEFTGRTVRGVALTERNIDDLMEHFGPESGFSSDDHLVRLPKVPVNSGGFYKILVMLTGGPADSDIRVTGGLANGSVEPNRSTTLDERPTRFHRMAKGLTTVLTVFVLVLASMILLRDSDRPAPPMGCEKGTITVTGSTAFEPVAEELAKKYMRDCPGSTVDIDARGSTAGIQALDAAGREADGGSPAIVTLSDGPKPPGFGDLRENSVAVSAFALVVHQGVSGVDDLTLDQVRRIYRGEIRTWQPLGGPNLPIVLISRDAGSGTREVFQRRVLGRNEPANSSRDCRTKDDPRAPVIRCELDSTPQVLDTVARTPGAIGYSELRSGSRPEGTEVLRLDGHTPTVGEEADPSGGGSGDAYPFRETEYAYTYGRPPANSLVSSFLNYMSRGSGQDVMRTHGHVPCAAPDGIALCAKRNK